MSVAAKAKRRTFGPYLFGVIARNPVTGLPLCLGEIRSRGRYSCEAKSLLNRRLSRLSKQVDLEIISLGRVS